MIRRRAVLAGALLLAVGTGTWSIATYNALVGSRTAVEAAWAQVGNVEQRRAELIPRLVAVTERYAAHERAIVEALRASPAAAPRDDRAVAIARYQRLDGAIHAVRATAERYPELHAAELYRNLDFELRGSENRIAIERERYNRAVADYRTRLRRFPVRLIAPGLWQPPSFTPRPAEARP